MFGFDRPFGANSDLKELEYISALHQTCPNIRKDGSINATDIASLLCSKYGIKISIEDVRNFILEGYAGGDDVEEVLDLSEIVSILIIPYLLEAAKDKKEVSDDSGNFKSLLSMRPDSDAINEVLGMIMKEVTGSSDPRELNTELLSTIFAHYGEYEIARDDELLDEMVKLVCPSKADHENNIVLDKKNFAEALTKDVSLFSNNEEVRFVLTKMLDKLFKHNKYSPDIEEVDERNRAKSFRTVFTAPAIDLLVNSFHSQLLVILLWSGFLVNYFAYYFLLVSNPVKLCADKGAICAMGEHIFDWISKMISLVIAGFFYLGLTSLGNGSDSIKPCPLLIGIITVAAVTFAPFIQEAQQNFEQPIYEDDFYQDNVVSSESAPSFLMLAYISALLLGCCALICQLVILYKVATNTLPQPSINRKAMDHKVELMVENALDIHRSNEERKETFTSDNRVAYSLLKFMKTSDSAKTEDSGGFIWCARKIWNKELYYAEGISVPTRVLAGNFSMLFVSLFILAHGIYVIKHVNENYKEGYEKSFLDKISAFVDSLGPGFLVVVQTASVEVKKFIGKLPSLMLPSNYTCPTEVEAFACLNTANFTNCTNAETVILCSIKDFNITGIIDPNVILQEMGTIVKEIAKEFVDVSFNYLYPNQQYMFTVPLTVSTFVAFTTSVCLMFVYIPSSIATILRLRCGDLPTLRDRNFQILRRNQDQTTMILGSVFWSALYSSILLGILVGFIVFLFLWQVTSSRAIKLLYYGVGVLITIFIKMLFLLLVRGKMYTAFYRKIPATANVIALALECWNIGISAGVALVRAGKLLLVTLLHIGRIDIPLLSKESPACGLDGYPLIYMKNILANEAHCHPYIELLGVMYLMKLQYGKNFATRAGSTWRLLFVTALMPWVMKYRVMTRTNSVGADDGVMDDEKDITAN